MSNDVKFHQPVNRLSQALDKGEKRSLSAGIQAATRNLTYIAADCMQHADEAIARLEETLARWPEAADAAYLTQLYEISVGIIGLASVGGAPEIDVAAKSLCDVLDGMMSRGSAVRDPVAVHIQAMRLLRRPGTPASKDAVIQGLLSVRNRFAPETPERNPAGQSVQ